MAVWWVGEGEGAAGLWCDAAWLAWRPFSLANMPIKQSGGEKIARNIMFKGQPKKRKKEAHCSLTAPVRTVSAPFTAFAFKYGIGNLDEGVKPCCPMVLS